jgi:hypothetical protein
MMRVMQRRAWLWIVAVAMIGAVLYTTIAVTDPKSLDGTDTFPATGPGGAVVMGYLVAVMIGSGVWPWWRGRSRRP